MASKIDPGNGRMLADLLVTYTWSQTTIWPSPTPLCQDQQRATKDLVYVAMIERMSKQHPNYIFLRNELLRAKGTTDAERGRAAVLEFFDDNQVNHAGFKNSAELESYLRDPCSSCQGRLYLLEDIATNYVEAFGRNFCINPSFFARQLRTTSWEASHEASSPTPFQSTSDHESVFSLCYPELVKFSGSEVRTKPGLFCYSNAYRYVSVIRQKNFFDGIGLIHRRFSFWSRRNVNGIWDGECRVCSDAPYNPEIFC
jgi:hypothetical protein